MAELSKVCGTCADYNKCGTGEITCKETGKPVGFLWVKECWKEKPVDASQHVQSTEKKSRGKRSKYPPVIDPETGQIIGKRCRICGVYKPLEEFYKDKSRKDGHSCECKPCHDKMCAEAGRKYRAAKKLREEGISIPEPTVNTGELYSFSDQQLVEELNARGWDVSLKLKKDL